MMTISDIIEIIVVCALIATHSRHLTFVLC